jgi:hypothetical protein
VCAGVAVSLGLVDEQGDVVVGASLTEVASRVPTRRLLHRSDVGAMRWPIAPRRTPAFRPERAPRRNRRGRPHLWDSGGGEYPVGGSRRGRCACW